MQDLIDFGYEADGHPEFSSNAYLNKLCRNGIPVLSRETAIKAGLGRFLFGEGSAHFALDYGLESVVVQYERRTNANSFVEGENGLNKLYGYFREQIQDSEGITFDQFKEAYFVTDRNETPRYTTKAIHNNSDELKQDLLDELLRIDSLTERFRFYTALRIPKRTFHVSGSIKAEIPSDLYRSIAIRLFGNNLQSQLIVEDWEDEGKPNLPVVKALVEYGFFKLAK